MIHMQLKPLYADDYEIVASGGALAASSVLAQIIADALGHELSVTDNVEITARGTAILSLVAIGQGELRDFHPSVAKIVMPRQEIAHAYQKALVRQHYLYQVLIERDFPDA